jgi:hypothetical protein
MDIRAALLSESEVSRLDRIKKLSIIAMFSDVDLLDILVLKGGADMDIVHRLTSRSSIDVDFSMDGSFPFTIEEARGKIFNALERIFQGEGYQVYDFELREVPPYVSEEFSSFWGGYKVDFKLIELEKYALSKHDQVLLSKGGLKIGTKGRFTIDVSKHEFCRDKVKTDLDGHHIFTYSPEMIICEKLRAICQQMAIYAETMKSKRSARARDFIDIFFLYSTLESDFPSPYHAEMLKEFFEAKHVPLQLIGDIRKERDFHSQDFERVQSAVRFGISLDSFDFYFDFVVQFAKRLETLWHG